MPSSCLSVENTCTFRGGPKAWKSNRSELSKARHSPSQVRPHPNPPTISFYCSSVLCSLGRILYLKAFHYLQRWIKRVRERTHGIETAGMGSFIPTGNPLPENPPAASKLKFFLHHRLSASPKLLP